MPTPASTRRAAERWFLDNGLPSVLTRRARWRGLWLRSAAVLGLLALCLPLVVLAGWLVSRLRSSRARFVASTVAAGVALASDAVTGDALDVAGSALGLLILLFLTATGLGSVLGWALRLAALQFAAMGQLMLRALPVVLLTVLVFFNPPVWLMASTVSRSRLWLSLFFLGAIAAVFLVSSTLDRVRPILSSPRKPPEEARGLAGTPFESMPAPVSAVPLTQRERFNVVFVLIVSQLAQVLTVAAVTAVIFFVLGLILLDSQLLAAWTRNPVSDGQLLWMTVPVPNALIQITLFLAALTFMYLSARAVGDGEYRSHFLDPLIEDLQLTPVARDRYRAATAGQ